MPDRVSVIRWLQRGTLYLAGGKDKYPDYEQFGEFCNKYARARELQLDMLLDECLPIADDGRNDWKFRKSKTGEIVAVPDNEMVNRSRLRVDTRFRMAEKLNPRKYGVSKNINLKEEPPVDWRQKTLERAKQRRFRSLGLPFMEREKAEATTK